MSVGEKTADREFLERLDQAVGCQQCGGPLGQSVSDDFCRPSCQQAWFSQHAEPLPATVDPWHTWADSHPYGDATLPSGETAERYEGDAPVPVRSGFDLSAGYMGLNEVRRLVFRPGNHSADVNPRPWRLPRSTGELFRDENALAVAEWTARTDAQRAACALRREDLEERRRQRPRPPFPGRQTSWEFDHHASPLVHSRITWNPVVTTEQAQQAADTILTRYQAEMSRVALTFAPPPVPRPALREGHHVTVTSNDGTHRYLVEQVGPGSQMTLRRVSGDQAVEGDEISQSATEETTPATPQARALEARRNRNTGPTPRPGRIRGDVPGVRR